MEELKRAIVTGGAGDIGFAIAARLARASWEIGLLDLGADATKAAAAKLPRTTALIADVTDEASVAQAVETFGGEIDLLVNNAGIGRFGPLHELSVADFRKVIEVNLVGPYIMARAVAPKMMARGQGSIVNITSINAVAASPGSGGYPAAKAGLAKLTEQMALEWSPRGIRVNAIAPGFIDAGISTPFYADPKVRALRSGAVPTKRLGVADDIAEATFFLASDASSYINGHHLVVDGGVSVSVLLQLPRDAKD